MKKEVITVYLTKEEKRDVEELANLEGRSLSQQMMYMVNKYITNKYEGIYGK